MTHLYIYIVHHCYPTFIVNPEPLDAQNDGSRDVPSCAPRCRDNLSTYHAADYLVRVGVCRLQGSYLLSRTQHHNPVTDGHNLTHLMGDKYHRVPFGHKAAQESEKSVTFLGGKHACRLIQYHNLRILVQRLQDLNSLPLPHGKVCHSVP